MIDPVIDQLLRIVQRDPTPASFTSSYWREYAAQNTVRMDRDRLVLEGFGIGNVSRPRLRGRLLYQLERLSYSAVTAKLPDYPSTWRTTARLARSLGYGLTFDVWKSAVIVALLTDHWRRARLSPRTFAIIGDGYGFLGALIRRVLPGLRMYCIDLPKTLVFQATTHQRADRKITMSFLGEPHGTEGDAPADLTLVLPQAIDRVSDAIDCAVNVASMQEMNALTIQAYFTFLRWRSHAHSRFYCVNRVEKVLPGGEVSRFAEYPWQAGDEIFLDGPCPYYRYNLSRRMTPDGARLPGIRLPFTTYFKTHWHRLVRLASAGAAA